MKWWPYLLFAAAMVGCTFVYVDEGARDTQIKIDKTGTDTEIDTDVYDEQKKAGQEAARST